jgi:hypothetical protein
MGSKLWFRSGLVAAALIAAAAIVDVATYDPAPWHARHRRFREEIGLVVRAAVALGHFDKAAVLALDRRTTDGIERAHARVRAYLALRRFRRAFSDDALALGAFDRATWLADYHQLKTDMAAGYANLDWMVQRRGVDLREVDREATRALGQAGSAREALAALDAFVRRFRDPHFRIVERELTDTAPPARPRDDETKPAADPPAGKDCEAAGYRERDHGFRFPFARIPGWTPMGTGAFPLGSFGDTGVLRIALLGEDGYLAACRAVFSNGIGRGALKRAVRAELQRQLTEALALVASRGLTRLLVDVTGNGGGTEWVDSVVALLTDRKLTRFGPVTVAAACDRQGVWDGRAACPILPPPGRISLQGTAAWTGRVAVLADRETGSAAEALVAWLRENRVATILGERTAGAGCGYISGGNRSRLRALPIDVRMPNCARFLDDGTNEIDGIAPNVELPMHLGDPARQATALVEALRRVGEVQPPARP